MLLAGRVASTMSALGAKRNARRRSPAARKLAAPGLAPSLRSSATAFVA